MKTITSLGILLIIISACNNGKKVNEMNPLLNKYETPFNVAPFEDIKPEHYMPAFKEAISQHDAEIKEILAVTDEPTFENTIETLERSGVLLSEVQSVFYNLLSANTNDELQSIAKEIAPMLSAHEDNILLNDALFNRINEVYEKKENLELNAEQAKLLEDIWKTFVRGGAKLDAEKKERLRKVNEELSVLTLKFGDNVLAETNKFKLVIDDSTDLTGLPQSSLEAAAQAAKEENLEGKWVFTIHKPSLIPFLQYSEKRELREQMFKAYINQGNHDDELDNMQIISQIVALRIERAHLLGYKTHADFILEKNMAKTPEAVYNRLHLLWGPAINMAKEEVAEMQKIIDRKGGDFKLEPWDWWYYAEKLRKEKYEFDDELLRPYFELEHVKKGLFDVANKLYGIQFVKIDSIPLPHPDAVAYEVLEKDGTHVGVFYQDFHPRASKRGGAWMNAYRKQYKVNGKNVPPVITMVMNFSKPTDDKPSLLTVEEVETMFHEFGHVLHGLLSDCTYRSLSGTDVPRDFVELPSQIMENWATEPEVLKTYALHYNTGEPIPDELIEKMNKSSYFNQGFMATEYLAASFLDMDWHTIESGKEFNVTEFEDESMSRIGLIPEIVTRYRSTYFRHIFAGGYSAGYYSYIWAEMLDADAFEAFKENGIFDQKTAHAFRENILSKGGTADPMELYVAFRGKEPSIDPLLKRKGFIKQK